MWGEEGEGQVRNGKGQGTTGRDGHVCGKRQHEEPTSLKAEVESNRGTSADDVIGSDRGRSAGAGH